VQTPLEELEAALVELDMDIELAYDAIRDMRESAAYTDIRDDSRSISKIGGSKAFDRHYGIGIEAIKNLYLEFGKFPDDINRGPKINKQFVNKGYL